MSTLADIGEGLERTWDSITEGWRQLRRRAAHALTRFTPLKQTDTIETSDDVMLQHASRWGLLAADVSENGRQVRVRLEVPGLEPDDFDLHVEGNVLVVRGEKQLRHEQTEGRYHVMECAYGSFERAVPLPAEVDEKTARARYRHGVLEIEMPKKVTAQARRIEVKN